MEIHASFQLHPFQSTAIQHLSEKKIHLALTAPTGAGKGVILEEIARNPRERILLLTPLIALGRQQALRFGVRGIPTRLSLGGEENQPLEKSRVWITSPEAALSPKRSEAIQAWKPTLIAVDEAHCLSEWGESFRPAYRALLPFIKSLHVERTLWMSATFPRAALNDLSLALPGNWKIEGQFALPRRLMITEKRVSPPDRLEVVLREIRARKNPGILFAGTRKNVERYRSLFQSEGREFIPYHAGMSDEERRAVESRLEMDLKRSHSSSSIVATNAFGMGMDYPHLEWVLLSGIPYSLLGLMQSYGRVGRAGRKGTAAHYWAEEDFRFAGFFTGPDGSMTKAGKDLARLRDYLEAGSEKKKQILSEEFI